MNSHKVGPLTIRLDDTGDCFAGRADESVLCGMERLGYRGIPVGCRGGGCGVCKVRVLAGDYTVGKMSRACVSEAEQAQGVVLACKLFPRSALTLAVVGKMRKALPCHPAAPAEPCADPGADRCP